MHKETWSYSNKNCSHDSLAGRLRTHFNQPSKHLNRWVGNKQLTMKQKARIGNHQKRPDRRNNFHKENKRRNKIQIIGGDSLLKSIKRSHHHTIMRMKIGEFLLLRQIKKADRCLEMRWTRWIVWRIIHRHLLIYKNAPLVTESLMKRHMISMPKFAKMSSLRRGRSSTQSSIEL